MRQLGDPVPARVFSDKAGPGAGPAVTADRLTPTASTIPTAATGLHYKGVSAEAFWLSEIRPSHTILRLYFTSSFSNTQARFYGIWGIMLNDLVVHCWPDRAFPDLDYKRKTASGKFSCRSMDTCTTVPSPSTGCLYPKGTHTVRHIRQRWSWVVAFMTVGSICTGTVLLSHCQHCS